MVSGGALPDEAYFPLAQVAPPTALGAGDPLRAALADHLSRNPFLTEVRDESHFLVAPGFAPIPWRAPRGGLFQKRRGNDVIREQAACAAMAFFVERLPARTFLDVGASDGYFGAIVLRWQGWPIDVFGFEIRPDFRDAMQREFDRAARGGQRAEAILAGMAEAHKGPQEVWYSVSKLFEAPPEEANYRDPWYIRLKFALMGRWNRDRLKRETIEITSIDHVAASRDLKVDLVKIDVDGYEAKVIPGGMTTFRQQRPVIFLELHRTKLIGRFGISRRQIVRPLFEIGYRALLLEDHHTHLTDLHVVGPESPILEREKTDMLIFWHPERLARYS